MARSGYLGGVVQTCNGFLECSPSSWWCAAQGHWEPGVIGLYLMALSDSLLDLSRCFLNCVHLQYPQHATTRTSTTSLRIAWKPTSVVHFKPPCLMDTPSSCIEKAGENLLWIVLRMNLGGFFFHWVLSGSGVFLPSEFKGSLMRKDSLF